jgi:hypothetical protein
MISVLRSIFGYCQEMSGIKGGKIPEISLSYLIISENRYLQGIWCRARDSQSQYIVFELLL